MAQSKIRKTNERFYDEYSYFDRVLAEKLHVDEDGVGKYLSQMKEAVTEAREAIPEWDVTNGRLNKIRDRYVNLKDSNTSFEDFQGKDEDVVWMNVFIEKLESQADPLSKYSKMEFTYKTRKKSLWQRIMEMFGN